MASKKTSQAVVAATPADAVRNALLLALRAANPDFNVSLAEYTRFRAQLAALGLRVSAMAAIPTVSGPLLANLIGEDELRAAQVPDDVPLFLHCRFEGREDLHNVGLLRKTLRPGSPAAFRMLFANVHGSADPAGRTASEYLLSLPQVEAILQKHLAQE